MKFAALLAEQAILDRIVDHLTPVFAVEESGKYG
jgi:hypothetical protein